MIPETPEEVLLKAADEISRCGLHKGFFTVNPDDPDSAVCLLGAIKRVVYGNACSGTVGARGYANIGYANTFLAQEAVSLLADSLNHADGDLPVWNDLPGTTAEDVILQMKKAAHDS